MSWTGKYDSDTKDYFVDFEVIITVNCIGNTQADIRLDELESSANGDDIKEGIVYKLAEKIRSYVDLWGKDNIASIFTDGSGTFLAKFNSKSVRKIGSKSFQIRNNIFVTKFNKL